MEEIRRMPRNSHGAGFDGMVILPMAARLPDLVPPISFDEADYVPDFHWTSLSADLRKGTTEFHWCHCLGYCGHPWAPNATCDPAVNG